MSADGYRSLLHKMTCISDTELWNDSCSMEELEYAIESGAVGATANPVIVGEVLKKEMPLWKARIKELIEAYPESSEDDLAWIITEEMSLKGAKLLLPVFENGGGRTGRLSIQTNPKHYRNKDRMLEQAIHFNNLAPNIIVKLPATKAGIKAIEEATFNGVSTNATVCFTVPQCLAVAEAVERGLERRKQEGRDTSSICSVCTIMVGRLDDWLKVVANKKDIITEPEYLEWAGVAVMKRAYGLFKERGYATRLLSAATRNHRHWSEFIGGDVVITLTHQWQKRLNGSDIEVAPRMDHPVAGVIIDALAEKFHEFRRAYAHDGMSIDEFDAYGATRRTLRQFINGYEELTGMIRDLMLPDPDKDE
jgi:transaldolase